MIQRIALLGSLLALCGSFAMGESVERRPRLRRPESITLSADDKFAFTANRRSGSLSVVDLERRLVVTEVDLGERLADMTRIADDAVAVVDEQTHELLIVSIANNSPRVLHRLAVARHPIDVEYNAAEKIFAIASLWSRRVTIVEHGADGLVVKATIDLPFAPRRQLFLEGRHQLLVADSFGGRLAVLDLKEHRVLHMREFPGHKIRGMRVSASGDMLIVSHQMLNELAHTVRNDVHWGLLMSNDLRWLRLSNVLKPGADLYEGAHMHPLGEASSATGDPVQLAVSPQGAVVVTLGGVGEVAIGKEDDFSLYRIKVGKRPTAVAINRAGKRAYTANTFGDSISIVDLEERELVDEISLGPRAELSLADRGELLFYDATLSHDSWMSCHSCHPDGHTNGMLNDNFSDKSFGSPKRVLSLLGRHQTGPFAWNASSQSLREQIGKSMEFTMQGDREPTDKQLDVLTAFVQALPPPPSIDVARGTVDKVAIERGRKLFMARDCNRCHAPPTYTTPKTYDVGIHDKQGNKRFNPPTLRGVGQRGAYFHDNRAKSLEDVFRTYGHQIKDALADDDLHALLAFLRSL
ncbi:MAG: cytochrome c peroxidase [Pirellulaceae bacterium]|nr:cytochrome c peroxidase [Pirellulaceae bacterium]